MNAPLNRRHRQIYAHSQCAHRCNLGYSGTLAPKAYQMLIAEGSQLRPPEDYVASPCSDGAGSRKIEKIFLTRRLKAGARFDGKGETKEDRGQL